MLSALLVLALGQEPLQKPVTFVEPAARLERLLPELSKRTGVLLEVSGKLKGEVVQVIVRDKPLGELMKLVAHVADAEWEKTSSGYRLLRTAKRERELYAREIQRRTALAVRSNEKLAEQVAKAAAFDAEAAGKFAEELDLYDRGRDRFDPTRTDEERNADSHAFDLLMKRRPIERVTARLVSKLDPAQYVHLEDGERLVFATGPTAMQKDLGAAGQEALAAFASDQNTWASVMAKRPEMPKDRLVWGWDPRLLRQKVTPGELRGELVCSPLFRSPNIFHFRFNILDRAGKLLTYGDAVSGMDVQGEPPIAPVINGVDSVVPANALIEETHAVLTRASAKDMQPLSPLWKERLLNPVEHEPLALLPSEDLLSVNKITGRDLVALLPDSSFQSPFWVRSRNTKATVKSILQRISTMDPMLVEIGTGGSAAIQSASELALSQSPILIKPVHPLGVQRNRADRVALAGLLKRLEVNGRISLASLSMFFAGNTKRAFDALASPYAAALVPRSTEGTSSIDEDLIRFYGTLTEQQRRTLHLGEPLPAAGLMPAQKLQVQAMALFRQQPPNGGGFPQQSITSGRGFTHLDVTDLLPKGVTSEAFVRLEERRTPVVITLMVDAGSKRQFRDVQTLDSLVQHILMPRATPIRDVEEFFSNYAGVGEGNRNELLFEFHLGNDVVMKRRLYESYLPSNEQLRPFRQLRPEFRKSIVDAIEAERKKREGWDLPTRKPPPPL